MSEPAQLAVGDGGSHLGRIITGDPLVNLSGKPAARLGDLFQCDEYYPTVPPTPHGITPIVAGVNSPCRMLINGKPAALEGDITGCGCVLKSKNPDLCKGIAIGSLAVAGFAVAFSMFKNSRTDVPIIGNITSTNSNNLTDDQIKMIDNKVLNYQELYNKIAKPVVENAPNSPPNTNENCNCK